MTNDEKAKAYDEALKKIQPLHEQAKKDDNPIWSTYEYLFPQLRESEDERIRKGLLDFVRSFWADHKEKLPQTSRWIIYLEKQKEQNPDIELIQRSWYLEGYRDREFGKEPKWIVKTGEGGPHYEENPKYGQVLEEQKPAEWSEEDERMRNQLIYDVEQRKEKLLISAKQNKATKAIYDGIEKCQDEKIAWLKSLCPSWKPSEEVMKVLEKFVDYLYESGNKDYEIMDSFLEHLQKL